MRIERCSDKIFKSFDLALEKRVLEALFVIFKMKAISSWS